jgi:type I restriction-modification system DNA methylase subunit
LEPEWEELRAESDRILNILADLWRQQRDRVGHYGDEAGLEQAFIQPLLLALGWKLKYQTWLQRREPDYALFLDDNSLDAALRAGRQEPEFWSHPAILADAKAWHLNLDRPTRVGNNREYPPEQIEWYLDRSRLPYAILTNGKHWRLIPRTLDPGKARFQTYLEVDIERLLNTYVGPEKGPRDHALADIQESSEDFFRFFLFFSPSAFRSIQARPPLIERARLGSSEHALSVGEDLKLRVFEALRLCIEGFLTHADNGLNPATDLGTCREQSLVFLYRLLFIMYAEDRGLLPYRLNQLYTDNRSLARYREEAAVTLDRITGGALPNYPPGQADIWPDLSALFDLIDSGNTRYQVPPYNGGLFSADQHPFLSERVIPDSFLARVIDQLGRAEDPHHQDRGLFRVDYRDLAIQHLGSIYEGLLELRPKCATEPMIVIRKRGSGRVPESTIPSSQRVPVGWEVTEERYAMGQVYLETDKGERRASGSYYTPDHIVNYIVETTLRPLCQGISETLDQEIEIAEKRHKGARGPTREAVGREVEKLSGDFDNRILRLRVLDPAMGSGHFLVRACQYLSEEIATNPHTSDPTIRPASGDEPTLTYWKRKVVETCIYGVDLNPMAVELAKLALWLETVSRNSPLNFLDHHLRNGNSLVGASVDQLGELAGATELEQNIFGQQVEQRLPSLLGPLSSIRSTPSETIEQVREKEQLYRSAFKPVCDRFRMVADLWCSTFFSETSLAISPERYQQTLKALSSDPAFRRLSTETWFSQARSAVVAEDVLAFHWELEFPECFYNETGRRRDAGFDAVVGNPPYDVLSELETGRNLENLQSFIHSQTLFAPSVVDKNNLYKLFICRALALLANNGRLGFITPMAVLGDKQASGIRKEVLRVGTFEVIEAFPQKDNPNQRVFRDAKLSTSLFVIRKSDSTEIGAREFRARVHPANLIHADSPSLSLAAADIPKYHPDNLTIVSCGQIDWDLATGITGRNRMLRLGSYCTSFQGEVNETNERGRNRIGYDPEVGPEVIRGAHLCLYAIREASQGTAVFVKQSEFTEAARDDAKATHHIHRRVGFQRKSPQNNFRRLIAAPIQAGTFLLESVSYVPAHHSRLPLDFVLALLNSKLADWYFRLGSTNAMVAEYQFDSLPCPAFVVEPNAQCANLLQLSQAALTSGRLGNVSDILAPGLANPPFSAAVQETIVSATQRIIAIESTRGEISRADRSALDPRAQPYQDLIDRLFYLMAGLSDTEIVGLESRLAAML